MMIVIFMLSSQEAEDSTITSTNLGRGIILVKSSILQENLSDDEVEKQALYIDYAVRKTAHATEYMTLCFLLCMGGALSGITAGDSGQSALESGLTAGIVGFSKKLKPHITFWIISSFYAVSDEIHQYFVPGRSAQVSDVLLDSMGAFFGVIFFSILLSCIYAVKKRVGELP